MCDVLLRVAAGGLQSWSMAAFRAGLAEIQFSRAQLDSAEALLLAEVVRQGGFPESMFGSKVSPREAQRRTKVAIALSDGSLPGAAEALASGKATFEHVAVLVEMMDRLPDGAVAQLLPLARRRHRTSSAGPCCAWRCRSPRPLRARRVCRLLGGGGSGSALMVSTARLR